MASSFEQALANLAERDERLLQGIDRVEQTLERALPDAGARDASSSLGRVAQALERLDPVAHTERLPRGATGTAPGAPASPGAAPAGFAATAGDLARTLRQGTADDSQQRERDRIQIEIRDLLRDIGQQLQRLQLDQPRFR